MTHVRSRIRMATKAGKWWRWLAAGAVVAAAGCGESDAGHDPVPLTRLHTDRTYLRDDHGRYVYFQGMNVSGSTKAPAVDESGHASYMERPFPLANARAEIKKLRNLGVNAFRLLIMWEAIEPEAKGQYDEAYLDYIREIVKIANEYGVYVLLDMHQDMYSRHLFVKYNEQPAYGTPGSLEATLLSLVPPYTDRVQGDGAPKWAVQACMPEKNMDTDHWGNPRIVSGMGNPEVRADMIQLYQKLFPDAGTGSGELPDWLEYMLDNLGDDYPPNETTDMLPFTHWGVTAALSMDVERNFACLLAGEKAFPTQMVGEQSIQEYLQEAFTNSWVQVAKRVADQPNVIGYDIINEPEANFLVLGAFAAAMQANAPEAAQNFLTEQLDDAETGQLIYNMLIALRMLPTDNSAETLKLWGLEHVDTMGVLGLNYAFEKTYMTPFYDRVGTAIRAVDPKAVFYIEPASSASTVLGGNLAGGMWDVSMTRPPSLPDVVFAPHNYADIYPFIGFNQPSRQFTVDEIQYRDYSAAITTAMNLASHSLGNTPVVFGEFGTYFNFNGIEKSVASNYSVSSAILDNYYEAFDSMFLSRMLWCYSMHNSYAYGDGWNKEDFSVVDPQQQVRSEMAWGRPFVRAVAGKPISVHFYSDYHYFDPDKGEQVPLHEFEVKYGSKESEAPTEIMVPLVQYPDGFYVWVSDGQCSYDPVTHVLYHYPDRDEPGAEHWVRMLPPLPNQVNEGWKYFFQDTKVISR